MSATATVSTMPWTRFLTAERLPLKRRKELLAWLGESVLGLPPELVTLAVTAWAHDSITGPALDEAWGRYLERQALADAVDNGIADWDWRCNSCAHLLGKACPCSCCPSASEQAHADAEAALDVLAGGTQ